MTEETTQPGIARRTLAVALNWLFERLYPQMDWVFLSRPVLFLFTWTMVAAGLGAGAWVTNPDLFWRVGLHWDILAVFAGATLVTSAAFLKTHVLPEGELQIKGFPTILKGGENSNRILPWVSWAFLGIGLLLMLPGGWLAPAAGLVLFLVWGVLYSSTPALWKRSQAIEALVHILAAGALFYIGWGASGAPLAESLNLAAPYLWGVASVSFLTVLVPGPSLPDDTPLPGPTAITVYSALAALCALTATIWGYRNGDPVIATTAVITLPFHAVGLYYRRLDDVVRTQRYAILIFVIFVGARYPWLFVPVIVVFFLARYYFRRRFGWLHPAFHAEQIVTD
jgi:hypothetical protein